MILFFYITENIYSNIDLIFAMAYATHGQLFATVRWFYPSTPLSFTNKTDRHDIDEIL
jgi:hypothetical protein